MAIPNTGFGSKTTAKEAIRDVSLAGRRALVTGANSGLGMETARVLFEAGAEVLLAVRSVEGGEKVASELRGNAPAGAGSVSAAKLDLTDLASVRDFAQVQVKKPYDLLINNAGIMATPFGKTAQGLEQQMGVNHIGHFLLTKLMLPALLDGGRIVNVSSALHTQGTAEGVLGTLRDDVGYEKRKYKPFGAYGDSKLANILFTRALAKRIPSGARTYSLHPGVIKTNLSRSMGIQGVLFRIFGAPFFKTVPQGAATTVFAATAKELTPHNGLYLSDCNEAEPSPTAQDEALAETTWELSEKWVRDFV